MILSTGIVVKCQFSRLLHQNRELARQSLIEKLDNHYNGEMSIKAQTLRLEQKKFGESNRKNRNLAELKKKYKNHISSSSVNKEESNLDY